ncbi:RNA polymerase sigma factor [Neobacillus sp. MM2021_6]|uniref:RNA polymerase sigma factor n=1 Tax=Bacillaceae TaxID=186817 RepID=UPI00140B67EE|nr:MULTISPECIES: RNA polymerase sigma factor [Bacillaceae]MBO0960300.1 RNA polymerase sigma factor [Neobacillus sp. MM2021_6]NHC17410.1 RNA polymerase sigma factor [Bacillus sp. MM2020_4]
MERGHQIETWFIQYEKDITNYLVYYTGTTDVEDLVQETFLRAFRSFSSFKNESNPKTWLISIARNTAIDFYRKKSMWQRLKERLDHESPKQHERQTEEKFIRKIEYAQLYHAINELKPNYRDVVLLRGIAELSSQEVGQVLGWSENKVNVTFFRAVKKLNEQLKEGDYFESFIG